MTRPVAPKWTAAKSARETLEVEFEVVTPVFGGGVQLDEKRPQNKPIDPVTPVRSASIRGHLRFWWRETRGSALSLDEMRTRESAIWGAASEPGRVSLAVVGQPNLGEPVIVYEAQERDGRLRILARNSALAYGAFSLQTQSEQQKSKATAEPGKLTTLEGRVRLRLDFPPELRPDVETALDAWLAFGGIGGRTRRGFGAVHAVNRPGFRSERFRTFDVASGSNPLEALEKGLGLLQKFRQGPGVGRNPGETSKRPGRSRWPEPETIRKLTRRSDPRHFVNVDKFPRAAFGMPVIFHFQSREDPVDTSLQPVGRERMASPLILRPVERNGRWICIGIRLPDRALPRLELKQGKESFPAEAHLSPQEAARIRPLSEYGAAESDPIEAFRLFVTRSR